MVEELDSQLARSQDARRRRIVDAVVALATEGGAEAVQMRAVAERADVSLRTTYNYFGSREELLRIAVTEWGRSVFAESAAQVRGSTIEARVLSVLRPLWSRMEEAPKVFELLLRYYDEPWDDPTYALGKMEFALRELDASDADDFRLILRRFFEATVMRVASGRITPREAWPEVEMVVHRLADATRTSSHVV
jgi:AcrR family transcriptional regulator